MGFPSSLLCPAELFSFPSSAGIAAVWRAHVRPLPSFLRKGERPAGLNATGDSDLRNYYDYVNSQRESRLRPVLERLLPIMAMSVWGTVPDGLQIGFPPLWTPDAKEVADIAKAKAETIVSVFQAGLMGADSAQRELKKLEEETGLFGSITEEEISANAGKTFQDVTALRDPLAGLGYETPGGETGGEESAPFEGAAQDAAFVKDDSAGQPRDKKGRWTKGGGGDKMGKTKYAPSEQRSHSGIQLPPKSYVRLTGILDTRYPGLEAGEVRQIRDANKRYTVQADGYGGMTVLEVKKIE